MCKSVFRNWTKNLFFWVVLILLAGANIYLISHQAGQRNEEISGHEAVYSEFKGTLTRDTYSGKALPAVEKNCTVPEL